MKLKQQEIKALRQKNAELEETILEMQKGAAGSSSRNLQTVRSFYEDKIGQLQSVVRPLRDALRKSNSCLEDALSKKDRLEKKCILQEERIREMKTTSLAEGHRATPNAHRIRNTNVHRSSKPRGRRSTALSEGSDDKSLKRGKYKPASGDGEARDNNATARDSSLTTANRAARPRKTTVSTKNNADEVLFFLQQPTIASKNHQVQQ